MNVKTKQIKQTKNKKIKIKDKFSRKHIGGQLATATAVPIHPENSKNFGEIPTATISNLAIATPVTNESGKSAKKSEQSNDNEKSQPTLSQELNDIRKSLIEQISQFDEESFRFMTENMENAINNSGSTQYPKKDPNKDSKKDSKKNSEKNNIFDEIDKYVSFLYDDDMTLAGRQIYYIDSLLQTYAGKFVSITLEPEAAFDKTAYDYLVNKTREYTKTNVSEIFKEYSIKMLAAVALHRKQNPTISNLERLKTKKM
jgi:hypothetical protein